METEIEFTLRVNLGNETAQNILRDARAIAEEKAAAWGLPINENSGERGAHLYGDYGCNGAVRFGYKSGAYLFIDILDDAKTLDIRGEGQREHIPWFLLDERKSDGVIAGRDVMEHLNEAGVIEIQYLEERLKNPSEPWSKT